MKSKIYLLVVMIMSIVLISSNVVMAYSPHYLPGGKNYLSEDNIFQENSYEYSTLDNFLIKPDTTYTFSLPLEYYQEQFTDIDIHLFENNDFDSSLYLTPGDFDPCVLDNYEFYCASFSVPSNTNYMGISFEDGRQYVLNNGLYGIQLEEGSVYTGYEAYIEGASVDTQSPYFTTLGNVISYYDSPITIQEIQDSLIAYDGVDGDVTANIVLVDDGYTANSSVLGTYQCEFSVTDQSGNSSNVIIDVQVVDVLKPVFSDIGVVQAVYPNVYTANDLLGMLSASDNYDGDISNQITFLEGNYLANTDIVGSYYMNYQVVDSSGNTQSYTLNIDVVDLEGPIINGIDTLAIGYDSYLTDTEILALYTYTDNYDSEEELSLIIESNLYTNNKDVIGSYTIDLSVTDSNGNKTNKTLTISVVDEIGPVIYMDFSIIQTYSDTVMELPDFINLLINTSEINGGINYSVSVMYDSYTGMENTPGVYHLKLRLRDDFGDVIDKDFEIEVVDREADLIHVGEEPDEHGTGYTSETIAYIIGGILTLVLAVTNIIWLVILKKRG